MRISNISTLVWTCFVNTDVEKIPPITRFQKVRTLTIGRGDPTSI